MQGEYRGDFTRDTFHPKKNFSRVLMQQGRVQLDADWNEQTSILLHYLRTFAADVIGRHGGPKGASGLGLSPIKGVPGGLEDFQIGIGRYYVDGIPCDAGAGGRYTAVQVKSRTASACVLICSSTGLAGTSLKEGQYLEVLDDVAKKGPLVVRIDGVDPETGKNLTVSDPLTGFTNPAVRRAITYQTQPFAAAKGRKIPTDAAGQSLVYLDVWERHVSTLQDSEIREIALGGPDTATRAQVVWQVKIMTEKPPGAKFPSAGSGGLDDEAWAQYLAAADLQTDSRGLLRARVQRNKPSTDPCNLSPQSRYRGAENQLYRVEIHTGGAGTPSGSPAQGPATFKWSRENGSVLFPLRSLAKGLATVAHLGRDMKLSLKEGDWVEIADDRTSLEGPALPLVQVGSVDRMAMTVTLIIPAAVSLPEFDEQSTTHPLLRRWDQRSTEGEPGGFIVQKDGAGLVIEGADDQGWLSLEDGIQIQFQPGGHYHSGDYWLIPARVASGDIEWPVLRNANGQPVLDPASEQTIPGALPPHGVEHHYAPLAILTLNNGSVTGSTPDLRRTIPPYAVPNP